MNVMNWIPMPVPLNAGVPEEYAVPVVWIRPQYMAELFGITLEEAKDWLSDDDNLGSFRAAAFPQSDYFDGALEDAFGKERKQDDDDDEEC